MAAHGKSINVFLMDGAWGGRPGRADGGGLRRPGRKRFVPGRVSWSAGRRVGPGGAGRRGQRPLPIENGGCNEPAIAGCHAAPPVRAGKSLPLSEEKKPPAPQGK